MKRKELTAALFERFPHELAAEYDNVGLLVGDPEEEITGVVVSLDVTKDAIALAKKSGANLILTHHPVIFGGVKDVLPPSPVFELIENGLGAIAMHTNLDAAKGGVNDVLCEVIGLAEVKGLVPNKSGFDMRMGTLPSPLSADELASLLKEKLGGRVKYTGSEHKIRTVAVCSGSGCDFMDDVLGAGADAFVTADAKHHHFGKARQSGLALFDAGHFETEDVIVHPLAELVRSLLSCPVAESHESGIYYQ